MNYTTAADIERWLEQLQQLRLENECEGPTFVKPYHLATLAHIARVAKANQLALPEKISTYADTMKLWDALGIPSPYGPKNRQAAGRYHPIQLLQQEGLIEESANALCALLKPVCDNPETLDAVQTMLRELIGNCFAHSAVEDDLYGIICGQVWNGGRRAQIALSDSGVGIRASLSQNELLLDRLQTSNSCEIATEYGVTGKPGRGHSGYGLAVARGLLEQNKGMLYVRSGDEGFRICGGRVTRIKAPTVWAGTLLVIEWDLDGAVDITKVYESFPLPEDMNDDDFNF